VLVQVEIHLSCVCVGEPSDFQINDNQAVQSAMKEQQIDSVPFVAGAQSPLTRNKGKVIAEFKQRQAAFGNAVPLKRSVASVITVVT
jgi:hypothetical protein